LPKTADNALLNAVYQSTDWLKTRINNIDIFDEHYQAEARANPWYALGPIFYFVWFIVIFTGLVLIMWYIPTKAGAYDSVMNIQHHIPFGGIFRGMHKYGADAMIIAATLRMYRMFLAADYKPGKEFNIAIGLVALLLSLYSGLTGYLLIWNQRAFWATKVFATFPTYMDQFPGMGDFYQPLVKSLHMGWNTAEILLGAGGAITQETLTRFFSIHMAFSLIPLIFVELYFYRTGFTRMSIGWVKRAIITLMLVGVAIFLPAAIGGRSNPDVTPLPILSDWYFLGLYQMYKYLEPVVATEITMLIPITVVLLPFIDVYVTGPEKDIEKRPLVFMTSMMGLVCWIVFSYLIIVNIADIHTDPPYWRDFLYLMVDIGILWQMSLVFKEKAPQARLKNATGALIMGVMGLIQSFWAVVYFFMARTEMFFSPISQAFTYWLFKPFMGANGDKAEAVVAEAMKTNISYWDYASTLKTSAEPAGKALLLKVQEAAQLGSPLDGIFQIAPTFQEGISYHGLIDFMVTNRWCFDYLTFCNRWNGITKPYPIAVPSLDWPWMVGGFVCMVVGFYGYYWCKQAEPAKPADVKTPTTAATGG
jgi:quinol-cytochrome oxidoreductase complex cytochrome b subunit